MLNLSVTPDVLAYILAGLAAILFDWFPGLSGWYDKLSELKKRQVMAGLLVVILAVLYGGACLKVIATNIACDQAGLASLIQIFMVMVGINQGFHLLTKPSVLGAG